MKFGCAILVLPLLLGCAQVSGLDDLNFNDTDTAVDTRGTDELPCGLYATSAQCQTCFDALCCAQGLQCAANLVCMDLLNCINICPVNDNACTENCLAIYPDGYADLTAVFDCIDGYCGAECSEEPQGTDTGNDTDTDTATVAGTDTGTGNVTQCGFLWSSESCQTCFDNACCAEGVTCASNGECVTLLDCMFACPAEDEACLDTCAADHIGGADDFVGMVTCIAENCPTEC